MRVPASIASPQPNTAPGPASGDDDLELVRGIQRGDAAAGGTRAWTQLLARYQDRLFAVCLRMVGDRDAAADLTQDSMVKIIQGINSFDGRSSVGTWLIRITMNTCLSYLRSQRLRKHASLDAGVGGSGDPQGTSEAESYGTLSRTLESGLGSGGRTGGGREAGEHSPVSGVQRREEHQRLAAALAVLPGDQRAILVLRDVNGLDYEQIAQVLGVATGTVKSRLFRARLALREAIENPPPPPGQAGTGAEDEE